MKIFTTAFIIIILVCFSCSPKFDVVRKEITNGKNPPNCVWLKDNLHIDETEISNQHYREYLYWLDRQFGSNSWKYIKARPDTLSWRRIIYPYDPFVDYYFRHPSYGN